MGTPPPVRTCLAVLAPLAAALALAPAAGAATTCTFDTPALVNVQMSQQFDDARVSVEGGQIVVHNGHGQPVACPGAGGPPTVTNTDTVYIVDNSDDPSTPASGDGTTEARIVGPSDFAPGKTEQGSNAFSEIEFIVNLNAGSQDLLQLVGGPGGDQWTMGTGGINWNPDVADPAPDAELSLFSQFDRWILAPGAGDDVINARGGQGTGSPFNGPGQLEVHAGDGNDTLLGGDAPTGEYLDGQAGNDTSQGFGGNDTLNDETGDDTLDGGPGVDVAQYYDAPAATGATVDLNQAGPQDTGLGTDTISNIESVTGSDYGDKLTGNAGPNVLRGGQGPDTLDGRGGDDTLDGGSEPDTATYASAPAGVTVDLAAGTATGGDGTDALSEVENVTGSAFADSLVGSAGPNEITGLAGADTVVALGGADKVDVRDGGPDTASCGTEIDTATADQKSVDAVNADCETVDYLPEPTPPPTPTPTPPTTPTGGGTGGGGGATAPRGPNDGELAFTLEGSRAQRVLKQKGVIVNVTCPLETCSVIASATGKLPKGRGRARRAALTQLALKPVVVAVPGGTTRSVKLRLDRTQVRALRAALRARKRVKLSVTVLASDLAGNSVTRTRSVLVKR